MTAGINLGEAVAAGTIQTPLVAMAASIARVYFQFVGTFFKFEDTGPSSLCKYLIEREQTRWFKEILNGPAKDFGIRGSLKVEGMRDPDDLLTCKSFHKNMFEHTLRVSQQLLEGRFEMLHIEKDKLKKVSVQSRDSLAYAKFFGIQALQHIALNTHLCKEGARALSLILGVTLLNYVGVFSEPGLVNILLQGLTIKLVQWLSEGVVERYQTFRADRGAVSYTQDTKSAVQALLLLRELTKRGFLPEGCPFIAERIKALDPDREISLPKLVVEVFESEKMLLALREEPEYQAMQEAKAYKNVAKKLAPVAFAKLLGLGVKAMLSGSPLWPILPAKGFAELLCPTKLPKLISPLNGLEKAKDKKLQEKSKTILEEMGSNASAPEVYFGGAPAALGENILILPHGFEGETPEQDFTLRHEMAHVKNKDALARTITSIFATIFVHGVYSIFAGDETSYSDMFIKGLLVMAVQFIAVTLVAQRQEARADQTAVSTASDRKRVARGGAQFFRNLKGSNQAMLDRARKESRESEIVTSLAITSSGEGRDDLEHPSLQSRIDAMESMALEN